MNRKGIAGPLLEFIQNMAHYLRVLHGNDGMQVITLDIGDVLYTTQQLNYIVLKHVNWVHINSSSCLFITEIDYFKSNFGGNHQFNLPLFPLNEGLIFKMQRYRFIRHAMKNSL